jgi:hypothetical protein
MPVKIGESLEIYSISRRKSGLSEKDCIKKAGDSESRGRQSYPYYKVSITQSDIDGVNYHGSLTLSGTGLLKCNVDQRELCLTPHQICLQAPSGTG